MNKVIYILCLWGVATSCRKESDLPSYEYELVVPPHFPEMIIPSDNPITHDKIKLGKLLFEDVRLSRNNTVSCASCHQQANAFGDETALSVGLDGSLSNRNSSPLFNLGYHPYYFKDGGAPSLEIQVIAPIENEIEMDLNIVDACKKLNNEGDLTSLSYKVFETEITPFVISRSIATYLRSLVSGNSRYDQYQLGDENALTEQEQLGLSLYAGKANCISCHSGTNFTNYSFENNGLYDIYSDEGRTIITGNSLDEGKFKVASLRNLSFTAPYMFDGSIATIDEVIEHYNSGGSSHSNKSESILPLLLTQNEKDALKAFLLSLNDVTFVEK